jgi:hypothetical protein
MGQLPLRTLPLSLALLLASSAEAQPPAGPSFEPGARILWNQNDRPTFNSLVSQNLEASFDGYDCQGADDFVVPVGATWLVAQVDVTGDFGQGTGEGYRSHTIVFYEDAGGVPGAVLKDVEVAGEPFDYASFAFSLPEPVKLKAGRHWVSVQANMDWEGSGFWNWAFRKERRGGHAVWRNPLDGFDTGCTAWQSTKACVDGARLGPDFMFALHGRSRQR